MYLFSINISSQHRNDISYPFNELEEFEIYNVYPIFFIELQKFFREDNK